MAINSYVGTEIVSSTDTFNVWLNRTNSIITDMGSVVVSIGDNNTGDVTITGALGANTIFAGSELRGGSANTSGDLTVTSDAILNEGLTVSGDVLFNGASANVTIDTLNTIFNSGNTIFNDHVEFQDDTILPVGTTVQRGGSITGNSRFNTTTGKFEIYTGSSWGLIADTADALTTARAITLGGDVTGTVSFDGSEDVTITTTLANNSQTQEIIEDVVGAMVSGNSETGITVVYQDGDGTLDFTVDASSIDHDSLQNFVLDEHVGHSSVILTAGSGLTGGGDITASRSFAVDESNVDHDSLQNFVANEHIDHSSVSVIAGTGLSGGGTIATSRTLSVNEGAVNHDNLLNFVANEHINHSAVEILSGDGLSGGGNITASRTLAIQAGNGLVANSTGVHIDSSSNTTFENLTVNTTLTVSRISANNTVGTSGQFLASNGTTTYWADVSEFTGEADTLDTVTDRGASTTNILTVGGFSIANNAPTIELIGEVTGSATFDGSNTTITTTIEDFNIALDGAVTGSATLDGSNTTITTTLTSSTFTLEGDVTGSATFDGSNTTIDTSIDPSANLTFDSLTLTNLTATNTDITNLTVAGISANNTVGTSGQFLASNGTTTYWADVSEFTGEADTLDTVTDRGSSTTNTITVGGLNIGNNSIEEVVGGMFSGNSESGISAVYQSGDNTIDFDVDDFTITLAGDLSGSVTVNDLGNATLTATVVGGEADTLATPRTINLIGEVTGNTVFDGSGDVSITTNLETINGVTSTGNIVLSSADIDGFVTATYAGQFEIVATSGSITVNWNEGQNQIQAEPTGSITYTFTDPAGPGHFQLIIASDGTSTAQAITFPASVKWMGNPYSGIDDKAAILNFYYDGTSTYYAIASYEN